MFERFGLSKLMAGAADTARSKSFVQQDLEALLSRASDDNGDAMTVESVFASGDDAVYKISFFDTNDQGSEPSLKASLLLRLSEDGEASTISARPYNPPCGTAQTIYPVDVKEMMLKAQKEMGKQELSEAELETLQINRETAPYLVECTNPSQGEFTFKRVSDFLDIQDDLVEFLDCVSGDIMAAERSMCPERMVRRKIQHIGNGAPALP